MEFQVLMEACSVNQIVERDISRRACGSPEIDSPIHERRLMPKNDQPVNFLLDVFECVDKISAYALLEVKYFLQPALLRAHRKKATPFRRRPSTALR